MFDDSERQSACFIVNDNDLVCDVDCQELVTGGASIFTKFCERKLSVRASAYSPQIEIMLSYHVYCLDNLMLAELTNI